jgi:O-antigen/teichoic acid export membrane protein
MAMMIFSILSEISSPQLNFMVRLVGENNVPGLLRKFFLAFLLTAIPGLLCYVAFAALGVPFIESWTLGKVVLTPMVLIWLALYCWLALLQIQAACFVAAHGRQPFALAAVCGAALNLGLDMLLVPRYGLAGATFSTFMAQLLSSNWVAWWLASQHLRSYSESNPGVISSGFRNAVTEIREHKLAKKLFAR